MPHYLKARPPKMQETYIKKPFGAVTVKNFTVLLADTLVLACSGQCAISESRKCCGWLKIFLAEILGSSAQDVMSVGLGCLCTLITGLHEWRVARSADLVP